MVNAGQLKLRALARLKLLHETNPGLGIIPHPNQSALYEELFSAGMCRIVARARVNGEVGSLFNRDHRRSFHFIDSDVGYTPAQLAEETECRAREATHRTPSVPSTPL